MLQNERKVSTHVQRTATRLPYKSLKARLLLPVQDAYDTPDTPSTRIRICDTSLGQYVGLLQEWHAICCTCFIRTDLNYIGTRARWGVYRLYV
jgi:hypothetical protein